MEAAAVAGSPGSLGAVTALFKAEMEIVPKMCAKSAVDISGGSVLDPHIDVEALWASAAAAPLSSPTVGTMDLCEYGVARGGMEGLAATAGPKTAAAPRDMPSLSPGRGAFDAQVGPRGPSGLLSLIPRVLEVLPSSSKDLLAKDLEDVGRGVMDEFSVALNLEAWPVLLGPLLGPPLLAHRSRSWLSLSKPLRGEVEFPPARPGAAPAEGERPVRSTSSRAPTLSSGGEPGLS